jgi:hypothetical protein
LGAGEGAVLRVRGEEGLQGPENSKTQGFIIPSWRGTSLDPIERIFHNDQKNWALGWGKLQNSLEKPRVFKLKAD